MDAREKIRNQIRATRRKLEPRFVQNASAIIQREALRLAEWNKAGSIFCYLAMPLEVQTETIVESCALAEKQLCVPAFLEAQRKYALARFDPDDEVGLGKYNVLEPLSPQWAQARKIDLVIVPGLAFDRQGGRLGHGGGHYDKLLSREELRSAFKVGLAFDFQMFKKLPVRAHDVRMDAVITESGVIRTRISKNKNNQKSRSI